MCHRKWAVLSTRYLLDGAVHSNHSYVRHHALLRRKDRFVSQRIISLHIHKYIKRFMLNDPFLFLGLFSISYFLDDNYENTQLFKKLKTFN